MARISYNVNPADKNRGVKGYLDTIWKCGLSECNILTNCLFKVSGDIILRRACCQDHADLQGGLR